MIKPKILLALVAVVAIVAVCEEPDSCSSGSHALLQKGRDTKPRVTVQEHDEPSFKVLVVGAPRTGTQSMARALTRLGFNPLHSAEQNFARAPWCDRIFGNGSFEEAMLTMKGFDSAMDEPFHLIYEEIMHRFPDCKFVLTMSDPEQWYNSCRNFMSSHLDGVDMLDGLSPHVSQACQHLHYFDCDFSVDQTTKRKENCLAGYRKHYDRVRRVVPPEKLLIFNLSEGYGPLAKFLDKAVPDEPFPYEDHYVRQKPGL